jgi:hypothetical protein
MTERKTLVRTLFQTVRQKTARRSMGYYVDYSKLNVFNYHRALLDRITQLSIRKGQYGIISYTDELLPDHVRRPQRRVTDFHRPRSNFPVCMRHVHGARASPVCGDGR